MIREQGSVTHTSADPHCLLHDMARDLAGVEASAGGHCVICRPCATPENEKASHAVYLQREFGS